MLNVKFSIAESAAEILQCYAVRSIVFVEEQSCSFEEEFDDHDHVATHFLVTVDGEPAGTARIREIADYIKFERLALRKKFRGQGIGRDFFIHILSHIAKLNKTKIVLHAQAYLREFYESYGFHAVGDEFEEAGIPHYYMEIDLKG